MTVLSVLAFSFPSFAQSSWTNLGAGNWDVEGNWSPSVPAFGDEAVIANSGTALLPSSVSGGFGTLYVGLSAGQAGHVYLNGGSLTGIMAHLGFAEDSFGSVTIDDGSFTTFAPIFVGDSGDGQITINGGTVSTFYGFIGYGSTGSGSATINGGTWSLDEDFVVGYSGTGSLTVNGGLVAGTTSYIGNDPGSSGVALVTGGTWSSAAALYVGASGTGALNISGGLVTVSGSNTSAVYVGNAGGASGAITLSGGSGNRGVLETNVVLKVGGEGTLTFDGGVLRAISNQPNFLSGFDSDDVLIDGGGAFIDSNGYSVGIATSLAGTGTLTKQGEGALTLSGSNRFSGGAVVATGTLAVGHNNALGTGDATVKNGATLSILTGFTATNKVTLDGGGTLAQSFAPNGDLANSVKASSHFTGGTPDTSTAILSGTLSASATITASFSSVSGASNDIDRRSDVLHLDGLPGEDGVTDLFVLELSMTEVGPGSFLGWLNGSNEWVNAALGNTGNNADPDQQGYAGSFVEFQAEYSGLVLSDYIGAWGFTSTSVWAVLNHNSDFAIVVPEPSTVALLLIGAGGLLLRRKRR